MIDRSFGMSSMTMYGLGRPLESTMGNIYMAIGKPRENVVEDFDPVNKPKGYNLGKVECIDAIEAATIDKTGIEAVCVGNVIKYVWRYPAKNGIEDVRKAKVYLDKLLKKLEEDESRRSEQDKTANGWQFCKLGHGDAKKGS